MTTWREEIAVTSPLPGDALDRLARRFPVRVRPEGEPLDEAGLIGFIGEAAAAITLLADPVTAEVLERCPRLRVVANYAVGYDNIDLDAARRLGIWVTNTPDVLTAATADLTWALILAVTRRVVEGDAMVRAGRFTGWKPDLLLGSGLQGKTLGILGFGRIGRAVARRAPAFGMEVLFTSRKPVADGPGRWVDLDGLLAGSDILSVHCPLTPQTRHLLDEARLRRLRPGAFVVNTARGPIVDEAALARLLAEGHLAGVGLDVYEHEPRVEPALLSMDRAVLLPHVGSATVETRSAMAGLAAANVEAVLDGREPPAAVVRGRS
ncbi:MAG TPA: D-glycerate dehydrogenase [Acidobacteria bacterium]|nr:D-glycerate dehydrogenase [Acidobacteriota bacterium]